MEYFVLLDYEFICLNGDYELLRKLDLKSFG